MARRRRYAQAEVAEALRAARGLVVVAARRLGCNRNTVLNYVDRYPSVAEALSEARELQLDVTEARLFQAIDQGELAAITFYLRTVGRHRGYSERHEVALDGPRPAGGRVDTATLSAPPTTHRNGHGDAHPRG